MSSATLPRRSPSAGNTLPRSAKENWLSMRGERASNSATPSKLQDSRRTRQCPQYPSADRTGQIARGARERKTMAGCRHKNGGAASLPATAACSFLRSAPAPAPASCHKPRPKDKPSGSSGIRGNDRCARQTNRSAPTAPRPPARSGKSARAANPSPFPAPYRSDTDPGTIRSARSANTNPTKASRAARSSSDCLQRQTEQRSKYFPSAQNAVRIERMLHCAHTGKAFGRIGQGFAAPRAFTLMPPFIFLPSTVSVVTSVCVSRANNPQVADSDALPIIETSGPPNAGTSRRASMTALTSRGHTDRSTTAWFPSPLVASPATARKVLHGLPHSAFAVAFDFSRYGSPKFPSIPR